MQLNAPRSSIAHASDACVWVVVWAVKRQTAREEKLLGEESLVNEKKLGEESLVDERDLSWSHVLCCDLYWTLVTFWISTDPLICQNGSLRGSGGMVDLERLHVCFWIL